MGRAFIISPRVLLLSILFAISILSPAFSAIFQVSPLKIVFDPGRRADILKIKNGSEDILSLQIRAYEWTQGVEGKDIYSATKDVIFFPRILTLNKEEERIVRVGMKVPPGKREKTYRIFIEEMPGEKPVEGTAVRTLLRMGIPLFLAPIKTEVKGLIKDLRVRGGGKVFFRIKNQGNVHFIIRSINLSGYDQSGEEVFSNELNGWYLHAGTSKEFSQEIPTDTCSRVNRIKVDVSTDKPSLSKAIDLIQEMCAP